MLGSYQVQFLNLATLLWGPKWGCLHLFRALCCRGHGWVNATGWMGKRYGWWVYPQPTAFLKVPFWTFVCPIEVSLPSMVSAEANWLAISSGAGHLGTGPKNYESATDLQSFLEALGVGQCGRIWIYKILEPASFFKGHSIFLANSKGEEYWNRSDDVGWAYDQTNILIKRYVSVVLFDWVSSVIFLDLSII